MNKFLEPVQRTLNRTFSERRDRLARNTMKLASVKNMRKTGIKCINHLFLAVKCPLEY